MDKFIRWILVGVFVILMAGMVLAVDLEKTKIRKASLESRIAQLEFEVANLESQVNYILSGDFKEQVCESCGE